MFICAFINHCLLKATLPSQYRPFTTLTHGTEPWPILRKHYFRNKKPIFFFYQVFRMLSLLKWIVSWGLLVTIVAQ